MNNSNNIQFNPQETEQQSDMWSLNDILYILFRNKGKIVFITLAVFLASVVFVLKSDVYYASESKIIIQNRGEALSSDPVVADQILGGGLNIIQQLSIELAILNGTDLMKRVVERLSVDGILGPEDTVMPTSMVDRMKSNVKDWLYMADLIAEQKEISREFLAMLILRKNFTAAGKDNVISLTYQSVDGERAEQILSTIVQCYKDLHIEALVPPITPNFFYQQYQDVADRLQTKEQELKQFLQEKDIRSIVDQKSTLTDLISELKTRISLSNENLESSYAKIAYLEPFIEIKDSVLQENQENLNSPAIEVLRRQLVEFQMQLMEMRNKYQEDSRFITELKEKITYATELLENEKTTLKTSMDNSVFGSIEQTENTPENLIKIEKVNISDQKARLEYLHKELEKLEQEYNSLLLQESVVEKKEKEIAALETEYENYYASYQKSLIREAIEKEKVSNLRVIQPPTLPQTPILTFSERYRNIALGGAAGIALGLLAAFLREYFDRSIRRTKDIENQYGLPVLATFSDIKIK